MRWSSFVDGIIYSSLIWGCNNSATTEQLYAHMEHKENGRYKHRMQGTPIELEYLKRRLKAIKNIKCIDGKWTALPITVDFP